MVTFDRFALRLSMTIAPATILWLAVFVPSTAHAEPLDRTFEAAWNLTTSVGDRDMNELGQDPGTGVGAGLRLAGSLWKLLSADISAPKSLQLTDWWAGGFGLGYLSSEDDIAPLWAAIRVEATLRVDFAASDHVDMFVRAGYLTGVDTAGRGLGNGYDALFGTAGLRLGKLLGEVGYGVNGTVDDLQYVLLDLEYAFRELGFRYVGLRFERFAGEGTDLSSLSLTLAAH